MVINAEIGALPEPYQTDFVRLIRKGAGAVDVIGEHVSGGASERFIQRELDRPREHMRNICRYIKHLRPQTILDIGCGTGGLTVALGTAFKDARVTGVDAVAVTVEAARVRAAGYGLDPQFLVVNADAPLPFPDSSFDLVTCTSVIEFITDSASRRRFAGELTRVARRHIVLTTPNPFPRLREQHTGRWFGDFRRVPDHPWASTPRQLDRLFAPFRRTRVPDRVRDKLKTAVLPGPLTGLAELMMPWQFALYTAPNE
jgi:SAM-dependent methyltransferase